MERSLAGIVQQDLNKEEKKKGAKEKKAVDVYGPF